MRLAADDPVGTTDDVSFFTGNAFVEPVLIDAGHCPHVSQPEATADAIAHAER